MLTVVFVVFGTVSVLLLLASVTCTVRPTLEALSDTDMDQYTWIVIAMMPILIYGGGGLLTIALDAIFPR